MSNLAHDAQAKKKPEFGNIAQMFAPNETRTFVPIPAFSTQVLSWQMPPVPFASVPELADRHRNGQRCTPG